MIVSRRKVEWYEPRHSGENRKIKTGPAGLVEPTGFSDFSPESIGSAERITVRNQKRCLGAAAELISDNYK